MRYLLASFFFIIFAGDTLGLSMSLAPGLSVKNLLLYLTLTGIAINAAVARNRKVEMAGVLVVFALLILYALATWLTVTFVVQDPEYQAKAAFVALKSNLVDQFLTLLIFFYGLMYLRDSMWLLRAVIWIVILGNIVTVIDTMNIPDLGLLPKPRKEGRFEGFIGQPNEYGLFLALFLPACIALFMRERGKLKSIAGIGVLASALALILTGSRGAYAGLLGGAVLAIVYLRRYVSAQTVVRAGGAAAAMGAVVIVVTLATGYADLYMDRFSGIEGTAHVATSGRTSIWSNALESMMENPISFISGYGFHSYDSSREFRLATHNTYLDYLYNLGAIGVLLFVTVFARILSVSRDAIADASEEQRIHFFALVFGLFSFLVATFFNNYHEVGYLLWAYVGILMRAAFELKDVRAADAASAPVAPPPQIAGTASATRGRAGRWRTHGAQWQ